LNVTKTDEKLATSRESKKGGGETQLRVKDRLNTRIKSSKELQ
jgi:hypothetical protein